ncbi:hypothetical protein ACWEOI_25460 [Nocardia sp. NPDC004340]
MVWRLIIGECDTGHRQQLFDQPSLLAARLAGMTMFGRHLLDTGQLRDGLDLDEVRDILWTYIAVEVLRTAGARPRLVAGSLRAVDLSRHRRGPDLRS